jgi:hypothetical protein
MKRILIAFVFASLASLSQAQQQMQPGRWEMSSAMKMQGMQMPGQKWNHCFTAQDIADGKQHRMEDGQSKCTMSDMKASGATYSYSFACTSKDGNMSGQAKGSGTNTSFNTEIKMRMTPDQGMGEFTQVMTGHRVGDCK